MEIPNFLPSTPTIEQNQKINRLRAQAIYFAQKLDEFCEDSRLKSLAMTNLELTAMWATKAVAKHPTVTEEEQIPLLTDQEPKVESHAYAPADDDPACQVCGEGPHTHTGGAA